MANVKYGVIITEIKGKIGGTVFQGGKAGPIARNKPVNTAKLTHADAGRCLDCAIEALHK